MRIFRLHSEGYIDPDSEFEYKHINHFREVFPLLHDHDYYEFFVMVKGQLNHFINNENKVIKKGQLMFIRPKDFHSFAKITGHDFHYINLAILRKTIEELFCYLGKGFNHATLIEAKNPPTVVLTDNELQSVLAKFEMLNVLPVNDKRRLNTELRVILVGLFSNYFLGNRNENNNCPEWLSYTINELQNPENFKQGICAVKNIACRSDEHISRTFKKYLSKTPTQYVNELRLNFAANQIRFSNRKIPDIAFESGFENMSYFYRQFKQLFQYTPNEFRKANRRELVMNRAEK